jgi:ParB family transcriptional regulator, chromosome partitioning protein
MKTRTKEVREIPLDQLEIGPSQARIRDVAKNIEELAESIDKMGLLEPIVVCPLGDDRYEIITGQRRFLAHQHLGRDKIMAVILGERVDNDVAKAISLTENMVRQDISTNDYIDACTALYRRYGSIKAVADELGLPPNKVSQYVKYDQLTPKMKEMVDEAKVDLKTAIRAQKAATDDSGDVDEEAAVVLAQEMKGLSNLQQRNVEKAAEENKGASVDEIIEAGRRQPRQKQIVVTISEQTHDALQKFATDDGSNQDDAASTLIVTGLTDRGYLDEGNV